MAYIEKPLPTRPVATGTAIIYQSYLTTESFSADPHILTDKNPIYKIKQIQHMQIRMNSQKGEKKKKNQIMRTKLIPLLQNYPSCFVHISLQILYFRPSNQILKTR